MSLVANIDIGSLVSIVICKSILSSKWFIIYTLKVTLGFYVVDQYRVVYNC